jgi:MFS family permease
MMQTLLSAARLPFILRALRSRNYRLFFFGQGLSLIGTWMQYLALSWLVFRMTGDEFKLGLVGFASQIPNLFFAPMTGVIADRWDRRRLLLLTQTLSLLQAATLAAMVLTGFVRDPADAWYLIGMSLLLGVINSVDITVRQAFVVEMVESRGDLASAIPLNSMLINATRFVGPPLAGLVVMAWGEGLCFVLNAASYLPVIAALLAMKLVPKNSTNQRRHFLHELREGFRYCWHTRAIRLVLLAIAMMSLVGIPYAVLMPAFAKDVFGGDAGTQGFLTGSVGVGAVIGTIFLAAQRTPRRLGNIIAFSTTLFGLALVAFAFCRNAWDFLAPKFYGHPAQDLPPNLILWLAGPLLAVVGFAQVGQLVSANTLLQTITDEDKRGRVMSLYTVAFLGFTPLGSLLAGGVARQFGPSGTVLIGGVLCLITSGIFAARLAALRHALNPHA